MWFNYSLCIRVLHRSRTNRKYTHSYINIYTYTYTQRETDIYFKELASLKFAGYTGRLKTGRRVDVTA